MTAITFETFEDFDKLPVGTGRKVSETSQKFDEAIAASVASGQAVKLDGLVGDRGKNAVTLRSRASRQGVGLAVRWLSDTSVAIKAQAIADKAAETNDPNPETESEPVASAPAPKVRRTRKAS